MCRVAVRNTARARPAEPVEPAEDALLYAQLQGASDVKQELDLNQLFGDADEVDIDADLQFLDMFAAHQAAEGGAQQMDGAVLGQPVVETAAAYPVPVAAPAPAPQMMAAPVATAQAQQMAALQQFGSGVMAAPAGAYTPAAALQQQYTQAILQQHMLAQMQQASASAAATAAPASKRGKSAVEVAEQQERIKRRRRESAQRSRQRKSAYMKSLEGENACLKVENDRLRRELARLGRPQPPPPYTSSVTSGSSAGLEADAAAAAAAAFGKALEDSFTGGSSDGGLAPVDCSGLGAGAAQELMGMVL